MLRAMMVGIVMLGGSMLGGGGMETGLGQPRVEKASERLENYEERRVGGLTVHVNKALLADKGLTLRVMLQLEADLDEIEHMVPAPAWKVLTEVHVWVERQGSTASAGKGRGLCCHWSPGWLASHGILTQKAGGVEIINPEDFLTWRRDQPYMLFHELAHALHWRLARLDPEIDAAFAQAMSARLYDAVGRNTVTGKQTVRAYAASNSHEYFAELSEAYFALNDYFPYTRAQLAALDPGGLGLVEKVWNLSAEKLEGARGQRR
ncbi:MAG: hypothetical protein AABZ53_00305 [Planctomycetota bacterium]